MTGTIFFQTDGIVKLTDFHYINDAGATVYINDGIGTVDVVEKATGSVIESAVSLVYIAASNGAYKAALPYNIPFVKRGKYIARVTVSSPGTGLHYYGELPFVVVVDS